jgi:hypothetical protein
MCKTIIGAGISVFIIIIIIIIIMSNVGVVSAEEATRWRVGGDLILRETGKPWDLRSVSDGFGLVNGARNAS